MTLIERQKLLELEHAVRELQSDVAKKLHLTAERQAAFDHSIDLLLFLLRFWKYMKVLGITAMSLVSGWLVVQKFLESFPQ